MQFSRFISDLLLFRDVIWGDLEILLIATGQTFPLEDFLLNHTTLYFGNLKSNFLGLLL